MQGFCRTAGLGLVRRVAAAQAESQLITGSTLNKHPAETLVQKEVLPSEELSNGYRPQFLNTATTPCNPYIELLKAVTKAGL